jgi:hypothetical protein
VGEYQYYEFQAVDQPLTPAQQRELRALSTRARITARSFVNHYDWGNFKGSPARLMEQVFDLHLYLANWGTRVFFMRLPRRLVDATALEACFIDDEIASWRDAGENIVIDFVRDEVEFKDWIDGSGWLAVLAPLRADILNGDLRIFYLVWLMAVEAGVAADDAVEPAIGLSPLSGALKAFAGFFAIDDDLIDAAIVEEGAPNDGYGNARAHALIRALPEEEKAALLIDLFDGNDPHLAAGFDSDRAGPVMWPGAALPVICVGPRTKSPNGAESGKKNKRRLNAAGKNWRMPRKSSDGLRRSSDAAKPFGRMSRPPSLCGMRPVTTRPRPCSRISGWWLSSWTIWPPSDVAWKIFANAIREKGGFSRN